MKTINTSEVKNPKTAEPSKFTKRIGSTVYTVSVHYSKTGEETIEDKLLRLLESEVEKIA